jgi:hypothetical protein
LKGEHLVKILTFKVILFIVASLCCSCGKKELDRQTAIRLLQGKTLENVVAGVGRDFSQGDNPQGRAFQALINAGILRTVPALFGQVRAEPGPNGRWISLNEAFGELSFVAGDMVVSEVTGITKTSDTSALAQVRLHFNPTPTYGQNRAALDALEPYSSWSGCSRCPLQNRLGDHMANATFQLFDDGWRLEGIQ